MMVFGISGAFDTSEINMLSDPDQTVDRVFTQKNQTFPEILTIPDMSEAKGAEHDLRIGRAGRTAITLAINHDSDYQFVA